MNTDLRKIDRGPTGHRRGASHPRSRLSDADVEQLKKDAKRLTLRALARKWSIGKSTAWDWVNGETRSGD